MHRKLCILPKQDVHSRSELLLRVLTLLNSARAFRFGDGLHAGPADDRLGYRITSTAMTNSTVLEQGEPHYRILAGRRPRPVMNKSQLCANTEQRLVLTQLCAICRTRVALAGIHWPRAPSCPLQQSGPGLNRGDLWSHLKKDLCLATALARQTGHRWLLKRRVRLHQMINETHRA